MNMFFKFPLCMTVVTIMATSMISCSDNNNGSNTSNGLSDEEQALKEAIVPYVDNTVIPTYTAMADEAILMSEACSCTAPLTEKAGARWALTPNSRS